MTDHGYRTEDAGTNFDSSQCFVIATYSPREMVNPRSQSILRTVSFNGKNQGRVCGPHTTAKVRHPDLGCAPSDSDIYLLRRDKFEKNKIQHLDNSLEGRVRDQCVLAKSLTLARPGRALFALGAREEAFDSDPPYSVGRPLGAVALEGKDTSRLVWLRHSRPQVFDIYYSDPSALGNPSL
jgi:hypothetical protein